MQYYVSTDVILLKNETFKESSHQNISDAPLTLQLPKFTVVIVNKLAVLVCSPP